MFPYLLKKNHIFLILILLFTSCKPKDKNEPNPIIEKPDFSAQAEQLDLVSNSNNTLQGWVNYYRKIEPTFSLNKFDFETTDSLTFSQGSVLGNFDENFDKIYSDFLVFSPNKMQYVDFDSYCWTLDENNKPFFSPDQEINLVDIANQTVKRIAFRGPTQWVENVFWENDSTIVFLENNHEKQPIIRTLNLKSKTIKTFKYNDTLSFKTNYTELRFNENGIDFE